MQQRYPWAQITPAILERGKHCRRDSNVELMLINDPLPTIQRITANLSHACFSYRVHTLMPWTPNQPTKNELELSSILKRSFIKENIASWIDSCQELSCIGIVYTTQARNGGEIRQVLSYQVARTFKKHTCFAKKLVEWEGKWIRERVIPEGKSGYHAKSSSWFNDEGVQLAVREWCAGAGERE